MYRSDRLSAIAAAETVDNKYEFYSSPGDYTPVHEI